MAISFSSATGNLFNRLGSLGQLLVELRSFHNNLLSEMTNTTDGVVGQYNGESDIQALMGNSYQSALSSAESIGGTAQQLAILTVNRMVFRDNPQANQTLNSTNTTASILEIIRQMKAQGATIQAQTVTGTTSSFTGEGNGAITISTKRWDGLTQENLYAETILATCTSDSYSTGAPVGNEGFTVTGQGQQNDRFSFDWPLGSNCQTSISAIDGSEDNTEGNILTNSGFDTFTVANTPDNWTIVTGTVGTNIFSEATLVYDSGTTALRLLGDGATLINLTQTFDVSTGTSGNLTAGTQYSCNAYMRRDGTAASAGVLTIDLIDGNDAIVQDDQGTNNSFTIDLTALTTNYAAYNGVFRTPSRMPATLKFRFRLTTALTNARSVYLDKMSLGTMTELYTGGPSAAIHAGSDPFVIGDYGTMTTTNNRGGQSNLASFGVLLERLFQLSSMDILFPSAASPSISDGLIQ